MTQDRGGATKRADRERQITRRKVTLFRLWRSDAPLARPPSERLARSRFLSEGSHVLGMQALHTLASQLGRRPEGRVATGTSRRPGPARLIRRDRSQHLFPERYRRRRARRIWTFRALRQPTASNSSPAYDEQLAIRHRVTGSLQPDDT